MGTSLTVLGRLTTTDFDSIGQARDHTEDEVEAESLRARLERELSALAQELGAIQRGIMGMENALQQSFPDLTQQLEALNKEMQEVVQEHNRKLEEQWSQNQDQQEDQKCDAFEQSGRDNTREYNERLEALQGESKQGKTKEIKNLWRRISRRTHPDRTDNPVMHELFREGRSCYNRNDLEGLRSVWACVLLGRSRILSQLIDRINDLTHQIDNARANLSAIKHSNSWLMWLDYKETQKRPHVENFYRNLLSQRVQQLRQQIHMIDQTRYPPPEVRTYTSTSTGFGWTTF